MISRRLFMMKRKGHKEITGIPSQMRKGIIIEGSLSGSALDDFFAFARENLEPKAKRPAFVRFLHKVGLMSADTMHN
jgi:hypothetical protein